MPTRNVNTLLLAILVALLCYSTHRRAKTAMIVGDALDLIDRYYVDPVDRGELLTAAMRGMTETLDRHSEYVPIDAYSSLQDSINQEFTGIGILIEQPEEGQPVRIITPLVGSPAREAGLMPGDEIVEIEGRDVRDWDLVNVSKRLKGPIGTPVRIVVRRGGRRVPTRVIRSRIEMESVVGDHRQADDRWAYRLQDDPRIAYLRLTGFGERTVDELRKVLETLDNRFDAMVLDLRGNSGGLLYAAVSVADMFLDSGRIVSTKTRGGVIEEMFRAESGTLIDLDKPLAVLIDGDSASASEIVAAALKDNGRAAIVGLRSYGKGTVQNILPLQSGRSALRLTVARYYRPNDQNIHRTDDATEEDDWGVRPSEGLEVSLDETVIDKLAERWRRSAYPLMDDAPTRAPANTDERESGKSGEGPENEPEKSAGATETLPFDPAASGDGESTPDGKSIPDESESILDLDPQLRKAVEYLRGQIETRRPQATAA